MLSECAAGLYMMLKLKLHDAEIPLVKQQSAYEKQLEHEHKAKKKELGFICLFTDENNNYWYKVSRGIVTAVTETLNSLETLIEDIKKLEINKHTEIEEKINLIYRKLRELYEKI